MLYIAERCVFALSDQGMELVEIAPGIDLEMDFQPVSNGSPRVMDARIFRPEHMGLRDDFLTLEERTYDVAENLFFVNFEEYAAKTIQQVEEIKNA